MDKIILSALMLATATTASAQVLSNADGKMHIGDRLPESVAVASLHIYDLRGTQIQSIQLRDRGRASVTIDGSTLQPGMYIYTLVADGQEVASKRMILTD